MLVLLLAPGSLFFSMSGHASSPVACVQLPIRCERIIFVVHRLTKELRSGSSNTTFLDGRSSLAWL